MNIDRFDEQAENAIDKLERGSKWLAVMCCLIIIYFIVRAMGG